ncbi:MULTISPECIES: protein phosphatase 2C domain-containing protein [Pseudofrankia]|uniref:protein phosphatase 2C domain-containing protein n=1 Tax=Pseudofrankia TaxID=2994363 RepID=UPI000234C2C8|nr:MULTISPECIES: protein phosphatase 2C domain-containing protein [Pseudofrankia]OHV35235.1 hypothetical protein BCD49_04535 [Pseudofrankia sp. EUN1h]
MSSHPAYGGHDDGEYRSAAVHVPGGKGAGGPGRHSDARRTERSEPSRPGGDGFRIADVPPWLLVGWIVAGLSLAAGAAFTAIGFLSLQVGTMRTGILTVLGSVVMSLVLGFFQRKHNRALPAGTPGLEGGRKAREKKGAMKDPPPDPAIGTPAEQPARAPDPEDQGLEEHHGFEEHGHGQWFAADPPPIDRGGSPDHVGAASQVLAPAPADFRVLGARSDLAREPWRLPVLPTQPAVAADQARIGTLEIRAASIIGPGHRTQDPATPRQDAYRLGRDTTGRHLIVAVADGMSDSPRSDHGATVAVSTAVAKLRSDLDSGATVQHLSADRLFTELARAITGSAQQRQIDPRDVRTGLIVGVVEVELNRQGRRSAWFGHLADVSAWRQAYPAGHGWEQVAGDHKGAGTDANTLRAFLPFHPNEAQDTWLTLPPGAVLAFLTDGVSDPMTQIPGASASFADWWATPPTLGAFVLDVGFEARTHQDDRTAVVVWCDTPPPGQPDPASPAVGARGRGQPR